MPTCKKCGRYGNVLTTDSCPYCNAKDWDTDLYKRSKSQDSLGCAGLGVVGLFWLALVLGGLWLLVFVVKWMWQHS